MKDHFALTTQPTATSAFSFPMTFTQDVAYIQPYKSHNTILII